MAITVNVGSISGFVARTSSQTWASIHDTPTGTLVWTTIPLQLQMQESGTVNLWSMLCRGYCRFDTSVLANRVLAKCTLRMKCGGVGNNFGGGYDPSLYIVGFNPASPPAVAASDYSRFGTVPLATVYKWSDFSFNRYYDFEFNAAGLAYLNPNGWTWLGIRSDSDVDNIMPTWVPSSKLISLTFYEEGESGAPILTIETVKPGYIWTRTLELEFVYTDGDGFKRGIQGLPTGVSGKKAGQIAIAGTEFRYIGNDGNEYGIEGSLLSALAAKPGIWIPSVSLPAEFQYTDEYGDKRSFEGAAI